jgi:hypothetical protein
MKNIRPAIYIDINVGITAQNHKIYQIDSSDGDKECGTTTAARLLSINIVAARHGHESQ